MFKKKEKEQYVDLELLGTMKSKALFSLVFQE